LRGHTRIVIATTDLVAVLAVAGCGLNKSRLATEQLVVSDAVDRAVAEIDFSPLSGRKVFLDTKYLDSVKLTPIGNVEYVISSLRQQMVAYDLRLMEKAEQAEFIVEARLGVMANDGHEVTYGIPGSAAMTTASVFLTAPVAAPAMPELSLGRRNHQQGTAKIGVFAYDRETREPVWQSGLAKGASRARDLWMFGLGPFESRSPLRQTARSKREGKPEIGVSNHASDPFDSFSGSVVFERAISRPRNDMDTEADGSLVTSGNQSAAEKPAADKPAAEPAVQAASHAEPAKIDHQNGPLKPVQGSP
jgi:hypothetical protein